MVLDPFAGVATVGLEALCQHKNAILCELYPQLAKLARNRIAATLPDFGYER